jgi:hypothetical protein
VAQRSKLKYRNRLKLSELTLMRYELQRFLMGDAFDLYEGQRLIARIAPECVAVEISYGKLVLSCWGEGWSRCWRVVACEWQEANLQLHCSKQNGTAPAILLLQRRPLEVGHSETRAGFAAQLPALIEANLPGVQVEGLVQKRDDSRHLSGIRARLILRERGNPIAALAVSSSESAPVIDGTLGEALIWLAELRRRGRKVSRLALFVPRGKADTIACRLTCLQPAEATISLYEVDEAAKIIKPLAAFDQADLADHLRRAARQARWAKAEALSVASASLIARAKQLAPGALESRQRGGWVYLSIRGLNFARVSVHRGLVEFGLQAPRRRLTPDHQAEFAELVRSIYSTRRAGAENRREPIFRAQAEGWLESLVRRNVTLLDPDLDPRFVYSQVPVYRGEQRTFIDLLAATRSGRLVVMELKVSEDLELPFQGLDYWLRIDWHRRRGDFERRGYFNGLALRDEAPLIYLVAPLFRFHATTRMLAGSIAARAPVYRIGINEDWRRELRVLLSERLN